MKAETVTLIKIGGIIVDSYEEALFKRFLAVLQDRFILIEKDSLPAKSRIDKEAAQVATMEIVGAELCKHFSINRQDLIKARAGGMAFTPYTFPHLRGMFAAICTSIDSHINCTTIGRFLEKDRVTMRHAKELCEGMMKLQQTSYERLMKADCEKIRERVIQKLSEV